jgi:hypothetical protein
MSQPGVGKISQVRLVEPAQGDLLGTGADLVREALWSGQSSERFGRLWHLGHVEERDGVLYGRLGYEQGVDVDLWREDVRDFRKEQARNGFASPFVIRMSDLVVVYQPRKDKIRPVSFAGALRSMLRRGSGGPAWRIESLSGVDTPFDRWRENVDVVTRLWFRIERTDVRGVPPPAVAGLLVAAQRDLSASVEWRSTAGIDTNVAEVRELVRHAEAGMGEATAVGRCRNSPGAERRWNSVLGDESTMTEVAVADGDGEVGRDLLLDELAKVPLGS